MENLFASLTALSDLRNDEIPGRDFIRKIQNLSPNIYQDAEMGMQKFAVVRDFAYGDLPIPVHSHHFYEISLCRGQQKAQYLLENRRYTLHDGDIIFTAPGTRHQPLLAQKDEGPLERILICVNSNVIRILENDWTALRLPKSHCILSVEGTRWEFLRGYFESALRESKLHRPAWESITCGLVITILGQIARAYAEKDIVLPDGREELLDYILDYIEGHLAEKITAGQIARRFGVSEGTLGSLFHRYTGVSFYRFVTQSRLSAAKTMISNGEPMEKAALDTGFTAYSAFYRAFKKEYGISPMQYYELIRSADKAGAH